ncbi:MAG: TadE family type IV pilus minor pilin [Friedmanniella sp.]
MVTAELAVAILAAFSVFVLLCWGILLLVLQLRCVDTATAVARQEARSDRAGSSLARSQAPEGASIRVTRRPGRVHVTVRLTVRPLASGLGSVPLHAEASVVPEPAAGGPR